MMTDTTLIPCERHAAVIGRHVAALAQDSSRTLDASALLAFATTVLDGITRGELGVCSPDFCVTSALGVAS